ncbi:sulfurtransferase-like selenium metabolism protein YedF [Eubacterium limosum]|uniref:Sulfurtransferase-like selenium metabolism protein YedF n=1 Tax=Eubacterium limosum TaxID=1736 RepID=A0ABT5UR79_EUBLI|nr:sulfurtransferase-like selenium metabolism protein YedF [Eubacterium limosum]MCB6568196.1 sulfurtransferase-like selenium metabolism protein YedF [Eubacterium limosum]MDE1470017.1 sulfurtransferase-like selenium metabolism protein YedF [Eubacterium limosum]
MTKIIDAMGKACPMPVIMAKKEIEANHDSFIITVDNAIAVENLKKLATSKNYDAAVSGSGERFEVRFITDGREIPETEMNVMPDGSSAAFGTGKWVVFMGKDYIGEGDYELGNALVKMFFYTLSQADDVPESILFMNSGVKLPSLDEQVVAHLQALEDRGVKILVCGTCLDYYKLKDNLKIGEISNMYDITEKMSAASKVITL